MSVAVPGAGVKRWSDGVLTPAEMRAAIHDLKGMDSMVASVMHDADRRGLSGEDRYTMLAYCLTMRLQEVKADFRKHLEHCPPVLKVSII